MKKVKKTLALEEGNKTFGPTPTLTFLMNTDTNKICKLMSRLFLWTDKLYYYFFLDITDYIYIKEDNIKQTRWPRNTTENIKLYNK